MLTLPTIIDIGSDADAGEWLAAIPFSSFLRDADGLTLCNAAFHDAIQNAPAGHPDGDRLTGSVRSFHDNAST